MKRENKKVILIGITAIFLLCFAFVPMAIAQEVPAHVVISEIYPDPVVGWDKCEFVELYNPTDKDVNLTGWTLSDKDTHSCSLSASIPSHGFFLVGRPDYNDNKDDSAWPDADTTPSNFPLMNNNGDEVRLNDSSGNIIDTVGWTTNAGWYEGLYFTPEPPSGKSIERKSLREGYAPCQDTNNNSFDFLIKDTPTPMNSSSPEMDSAPVELFNETGNFTGDFKKIQDAVNNASGGYLIIVHDGNYNENVNVNVDNLTIRSENGAVSTIVTASNSSDHVFDVSAGCVNISGFTIKGANGGLKAGINIGNPEGNCNNCNISNNVVTSNNFGIFVRASSDYDTLMNNKVSSNTYGIKLSYSDYTNITNNIVNANNNYGIFLQSSTHNNITNNTVNSNKGSGDYGGIRVSGSSNNITGNTVNSNTNYGIKIYSAGGEYNTLRNNNISNNSYGISLNSSSNNTLTSNTASNNTNYDFYSDESSHDNVIEDLTISSYPTTISFTYDNGVKIKGVETAPPDPDGKANISKYVNATNVTANSWLFLNISYNESDVSTVSEYCLKMYGHNGTAWEDVPGSDVNTAENYVYANLTEFSIFAPLGGPTATIPTATGSGNAIIETSSGYFCDETEAATLNTSYSPNLPDSAITFPHGFFNITICGLNTANPETVTINFTFPSAIPTNAEFWKYNSSNDTWYRYPFDDNDGDNVISIAITDNGAGDHNPALGIINDPNGIGWRTAAEVPVLTPVGLLALISILSAVLAVATSRRRE